jgi:hypothetical protein
MKSKKIVQCALFMLMLILTPGCADQPEFEIGIAPNGLPIVLTISSEGVAIKYNGKIHLPFVTVSIGYPVWKSIPNRVRHATYIEVLNRKDGNKLVYKLTDIGEQFRVNTKYESQVTVTNRQYATLVTVDAEEISDFLHIAPTVTPKPGFPSSPIPYFALTQLINVDWSVNDAWDILQDILFGVLYAILFILDVIIIVIIFVLRLLWFIGANIVYFFASMFAQK